MRSFPVVSLVLGLSLQLVSSDGTVGAAQPPAPPVADAPVPVFGAESSVVLLDVVVRDKKGRLIRDLQQSDFEVLEDGKKQTVSAFRLIDRTAERVTIPEAGASTGPSTTTTPTPAPPAAVASEESPIPAVIVFIFDRMGPQSLSNAQKAAMAYVNKGHVEGDMVGVFALDQALHTIQPFTADIEAVRAAFNQVVLKARTPYAEQRDTIRDLASDVRRADQNLAGLGSSGAQADAATQAFAASVGLERVFASMQERMLQSFDRLERDQQGFATTNGLSAMVSGLKGLPGRKTIVLFSEGLSVTASVVAQFRGVIAAANRANVTVYAIDAGGLRLESDTRESRDELVRTSQRRIAQEGKGGVDGSEGPMMAGVEQVEDRLRSSPKAGLNQLAEETGGFLVADSNDAGKGFSRIQEEMRFYYLLSYSPTDPRFDGGFRTITVKVNRPGMLVSSRKGYFAVPPDVILPLRTFEAPVVAQLNRTPAPRDLPLTSAALSFPEIKRPGRVPVMMHMPLSGVQFDLDKAKKIYKADFTLLARIVDPKGVEVDRMSREYPVSVPADKIDAAKTGDVFFFQETDIAPGSYTLESVAYDSLSKKASVQKVPLEVSATSEEAIRLSSLILIRKVEKLTAEELGRDNPLYVGETILYPNMGEAVSKSKMPALGFFFSAYVPAKATAPRQAQIEIIKAGSTLAKLPVTLAAANGSGRIQHAAALPVASLTPGEYVLRVSIPSGPAMVSRQTAFVITD